MLNCKWYESLRSWYILGYYRRRWGTGLALGYGLDDRGFESRHGLGIILFTTASIPALRPTQPSIQWVTGSLSLGVKVPRREADHSPPFSAEGKNAWSYTSTPPVRLHGLVLRDNFTFYPYRSVVVRSDWGQRLKISVRIAGLRAGIRTWDVWNMELDWLGSWLCLDYASEIKATCFW
jgi:hypothetical protein